MGRLTVTILLASLLRAWGHPTTAPRASPPAPILEEIRTNYSLPGLAVGELYPNRTFHTAAVGYRKEGAPAKAQVTDLWHLGSNTKAMTATLAAILVEEGVFKWTTTLLEALPSLKSTMHPSHHNTTLAQLTAHRSGISKAWETDVSFVISLYGDDVTPVQGRLEVANTTLSIPTVSTPGIEFEYANGNYIILGYIIDTLAGPWEDLIRSKLWKPLCMEHCGFGPVPLAYPNATNEPWPHYINTTTTPPVITPLYPDKYSDNFPALGPAGTAHCDITSYSKFLGLHLDGWNKRMTAVLPPSAFEILHTAYPSNDTVRYTSGGWATQPDPTTGKMVLIHDGSNTLNYAEAYVIGDLDTAFTSNTNVGGTLAAQGVDWGVYAMLNGQVFGPA